jgi:HJR/Mrr/RecB family endonuclease
MELIKFEGLLKETCESYSKAKLISNLQQKLDLPSSKAEDLAKRLQAKIDFEALSNVKRFNVNICSPEPESKAKVNIYSVDYLSGREFEYFLKWLFESLGFEVELCKQVADSGVDLVVKKEKQKIAVQAKRYQRSIKVSNSVILKTQGGMGVYQCKKAIVITTSYFTQNAYSDASKLGIELWDRETLACKIDDINNKTAHLDKIQLPPYKGSLVKSLHALEETKEFSIETKDTGKYDLHIYGIKSPLLSYQTRFSTVTKCILRFNRKEPVSEADGEKLIWTKRNEIEGLDEEDAYDQIRKYLQQFLC